MALTNNGTKVSIASALLPSGYTKPTITEFTDNNWLSKPGITLTVDKATVDEATETATFTALVAAVNTAAAVEAADYNASNTVTMWTDFKAVTTNAKLGDVLYTTGTVNYICTVDIYVKVV